jgi:hypothetical protein
MASRGWTVQEVDAVLNQPHATRTAVNRATGNAATAYFRFDGHYVVRDDVTSDIIQISNRNDPGWLPDPGIQQS